MRFTIPLETMIKTGGQHSVLRHVRDELLLKSAGEVCLKDNDVTFKGTTGHPTRSFFGSIGGGRFTLVTKGQQSFLVYQYSMFGYLIRMLMIGITAGPIIKWWFSIIAFIALGSINHFITFYQQQKFASQLAKDIDALYHSAWV